MGLICRLKNFRDTAHMAVAIESCDNEELKSKWYQNVGLYRIRISLEIIEKHCGGINFPLFDDPLFLNALSLEDGGITPMGYNPNPQYIDAIRNAWFNENLYTSVLSGNPGVLAKVDNETLSWFGVLLDGLIQHYNLGRTARKEYDERELNWPGYKNPNASWLDN